MSKRYIILAAILGLVGINSCKMSEPDYFIEMTGLYMDNRLPNKTHTDSVYYTFIYEDGDQLDIPVRIQLVGRKSDVDRPFALEVNSADAVKGVDYELISDEVLPSGTTSYDYMIRLKRTEILKTQEKTLTVTIKENEEFVTPFAEFTQAGSKKTSATQYKIVFSDQFKVAPAGWREMFIGRFTQQKFELIADVMKDYVSKSDFNIPNKIDEPTWIFIQTEMIIYVNEQVKLKEKGESYDVRAFYVDNQGIERPMDFV